MVYDTAIKTTDSFYTKEIINCIEKSHVFNLSRESLRNLLLSVNSFQIGNQ